MNTWAILRVTLGALAICGLQGAAQNSANGHLILCVHLYDPANVPSKTLNRAIEETANILAVAGVQVLWQPGEPHSAEGRTIDMTRRPVATDGSRDDRAFVVVRIVRGFPATALPRALGFALPFAQNGVHVTVFYDRIEEVALSVPPGVARILGDALAHEIGHVLLGSEQHSQNGIMKAVWSRADYQHLAARQFEFLPRDAVVLREEVSRRARLWDLRANVSNATVRCLSNMKLAEMMETRHNMSQTVRAEVTDKSQAWGYQLGSVYIRKVHFRDVGMIHQIEEKVVNRLRQVTSAIRQAGSNQVSVITSSAEREAAIEFAKAAAIRPATLGQAFQEIAREPEVATALFDVLETQRILASSAKIALLPGGPHGRMLANLMAAEKQG
jgi:hypothetical protein